MDDRHCTVGRKSSTGIKMVLLLFIAVLAGAGMLVGEAAGEEQVALRVIPDISGMGVVGQSHYLLAGAGFEAGSSSRQYWRPLK